MESAQKTPGTPQSPNAINIFLVIMNVALVGILIYFLFRNNPFGNENSGATPTPTVTSQTSVTPPPITTLSPTITTTVTGTVTPSPTTANGITMKVYMFSTTKFDQESAQDYTVAVNRTTTRQDVAAFGVEEIVKGPIAAEQTASSLKATFGAGKMVEFTSNSSCYGKDFTISIDNGDATVFFCRGTKMLGDSSGYVVTQQIANTLKQFASIKRVRVLNNTGNCFDEMSGQGQTQCWQ